MVLTIMLSATVLSEIVIYGVWRWLKSDVSILITHERPEDLQMEAFKAYVRKRDGSK